MPPDCLGERCAEEHQAFVALARVLHAGRGGLGDQVGERDAVTVAEGRSLRLSVIGEHREAHRPGRPGRRTLETGELLVELAEDLQRLRALDARVMRDLVVTGERRVEDGAPGEDVPDDGRDLQIALDHGRPRAHEGVLEAAVHAGPDVEPLLLRSLPQLARDVGDHESDRAREVVRVREVREVVAADAARAVAPEHRAHRQQAVRRVTGVHVGSARAVRIEQPLPVRDPLLDRSDVPRPRRRDLAAGLLVPPAKRRDVLVRAVQDAGLRGSGLRRPIALPADQVMAAVVDPSGHRGRVPVPDRPHQHGMGEAVDLEEVQGRNVGLDRTVLPRLPADHVAVVEVVVVDREQRGPERADDREANRDDDARPDVVDGDAGRELSDKPDDEAVQDQDAETERQHGERQGHGDQRRPDQSVHETDQGGGAKRRPERVDVESAEQPTHQQESRRAGHPDDEQAQDDRAELWPGHCALPTSRATY